MKEHASMKRVLKNSSVLANYSFLANVVKLIGVIFMNAKITETVLLLLSTILQHLNANVLTIMVGQLVTLTYAWILNVEMGFVLAEFVSVMKIMSIMETFV